MEERAREGRDEEGWQGRGDALESWCAPGEVEEAVARGGGSAWDGEEGGGEVEEVDLGIGSAW